MSEKSVAQVLREARELISDPERWTRGAYARDAEGNVAGSEREGDPCHPDAVCFCAFGAIARVEGVLVGRAADFFENEFGFSPERDNDGGDHLTWDFERKPRPAPARHRKVLAKFDKAIKLAEERGV